LNKYSQTLKEIAGTDNKTSHHIGFWNSAEGELRVRQFFVVIEGAIIFAGSRVREKTAVGNICARLLLRLAKAMNHCFNDFVISLFRIHC